MNERPDTLLDEYLEGNLTLDELQSSLQALVAENDQARHTALAHVEHAYRKGWLQPQVHQLLKQQLTPFAESPGRSAVNNDPTQLDARRHSATSDPTVGDIARTDKTVRSSQRAERQREQSATTTGTSTWEHPEEWVSVHDGPIGPRTLVKKRFLLEERLGHGGMGVVYKAVDGNKVNADDPEPHVAIKILNEEFRRHPVALVALQREARNAQKLSHPNIVSVHDFDRDGTLVFIHMELLEGQELKSLIDANRFGGIATPTAISYINQLVGALAHAHDEGYVHCDLKPGNVFVTREGRIKIFDFGIARALPSGFHDRKADTFDVAQLGAYTEAYASPEVLEGADPEKPDDVYSLGIVCYEILTGSHPFENRMRADKARDKKCKPLPIRGISRRRRKALERALSFKRARRQRDAGEFLRQFAPIPVRHWVVAAATAAALAVGYVGVKPWVDAWMLERDFQQLPPEQKQEFNTFIEQGRFGLELGAREGGLPGAFEFFSRAFAIHPYNPRAIAGLEEVANQMLALPPDEGARRENLSNLYCQEYLATYKPLVDECPQLFGPTRCEEPQRICPAR